MKIGIDLGGTNIRAGLIENGKVIRKIIEPCKSDKPEKEVLEQLQTMISSLLAPDVESIGIGVPSVVNVEQGIVYNVANIPSWVEVPLKDVLEKTFHIPVAVNNDSNCFALGEYHFGQGAAYEDLVCLTLGTGVGAGIILRGKLYAGHNTGAGEIGCLPYLAHDYEYYCGSRYFSEEHGITGKEAYERSLSGDQQAKQIWNEMGWHLGSLLKAILLVYDPQAIILGGSISKAYVFFSAKMYENMQDFLYPESVKNLKIHISEKKDIALLGASILAG
ncbi:MAG: ROK family protein [Tannerella sp.]|jgi:glucokinase|nr:ROK family protein [Tannerella sp.]